MQIGEVKHKYLPDGNVLTLYPSEVGLYAFLSFEPKTAKWMEVRRINNKMEIMQETKISTMAAQYRYKKKRDKSEPIIKAALEAHGCTVWPMDTPVDLLVGYCGRNYLIECKTLKSEGGKDKPTEVQTKFAENWNGEPYYTLRTVEDVTAWIKEIQI